MGKTSIEWTEYSWNPIRARNKATGKQGHACVRVSPGCKNCYAASMNVWRGTGVDYTLPGMDQVEVYLDEDVLLEPLRWRKPRQVFVCSMTDLFADFVKDEWIDMIYAVMALARHTFMVLTKRPARRLRWYREVEDAGEGFRDALVEGTAQSIYAKLHPEEPAVEEWLAVNLPLANVREGTSVCTQKEADELVPITRATPAALRWLSVEPIIEEITIPFRGPLPRLGWVVVGGESGHKARPTSIEAIRSIVRQCALTDTKCFVKQLGKHPQIRTGVELSLVHPKGGDIAEWPADLRVRQTP